LTDSRSKLPHHPRLRRALARARLSSLVIAASLLGGCLMPLSAPTPTPTIPTPTAETSVDNLSTWEQIAPGIERRIYRPGADQALTQFLAVRIDPALYSFRAHYTPGDPKNVMQWRDQLPDAAAFVNANFFDTDGQVLGLLVSDGAAHGTPYVGYGGMFQVQNSAPRIRSTIVEPYIPGESLETAVQAFPMLVLDRAGIFTNTQGDRISRRTVVGQDGAGRIVLLVTTSLVGMRLVDLSAYLPTTDLDLINAINLDGGGSTLLYARAAQGPAVQIPSLDPVPAILAAYPKP
jgi:uncharacterized protein YigE (DUF2233 family)